MITTDQVQTVRGGNALDSNGEKIGSIGEVYLDDRTGNPAWVTVNTGLFGTSESFIPLQDASVEGKDVKVPYTKERVKDAPRVDAEQHLDVEQEKELYRYYGVSYEGAGTDGQAGRTGGDDAPTETFRTGDVTGTGTGTADAGVGTAAAGTAAAGTAAAGTAAGTGLGDRAKEREAKADADVATNRAGFDAGPGDRSSYDTKVGQTDAKAGVADTKAGVADTKAGAADTKAGVTGERVAAGDPRDLDGDGVVTRYEERLSVAKERRESGRVRLRKSVVTEDQTVTVPLQREEVSLERIAIDNPEVVDGDPFGDDVREFVLYEEVPVVSKQAVAVERVGLRKNMVQEERQVTDKIRKEQIDLDGDGIPDNLKSGFKADNDKGTRR